MRTSTSWTAWRCSRSISCEARPPSLCKEPLTLNLQKRSCELWP